MHSEPNGARPPCNQPGEERASLYAVVIYLPDPLGAFLDRLRRAMVPGCNPHAHVSVLPPRPLPVAPEAAIREARAIVADFAPFDVDLGGIEKFDLTDVIYITVERGADRLREIHRRLNQGALAFDEPFAYHPHVTLAQEIEPSQVESVLESAVHGWRDYRGPRGFRAAGAVFVRNSDGKIWDDLADEPFAGAPAGR